MREGVRFTLFSLWCEKTVAEARGRGRGRWRRRGGRERGLASWRDLWRAGPQPQTQPCIAAAGAALFCSMPRWLWSLRISRSSVRVCVCVWIWSDMAGGRGFRLHHFWLATPVPGGRQCPTAGAALPLRSMCIFDRRNFISNAGHKGYPSPQARSRRSREAGSSARRPVPAPSGQRPNLPQPPSTASGAPSPGEAP